MKKLLFAIAAVATVLIGGTAVASAQWSLSYGYRWPVQRWSTGDYSFASDRGYSTRGCGFVTVRETRNGEIVARRVPRC